MKITASTSQRSYNEIYKAHLLDLKPYIEAVGYIFHENGSCTSLLGINFNGPVLIVFQHQH